ncbi:hypothetical protein EJB05_55561 [Eragrostis curvula]|uniref:Protein kinase domain-containing protein n=1 Tax=Eragrostis curvula TaxID=38414 RepID=A0A5J9SJJ6_9POAL|nr:hypothetical protein EJB05_55561 [Eragrostis curvula]
MAVEHGDGVGRCILVGLHMDAVGRELLQWALNQAARRGDRVVAVHIYRKSDLSKTNTLTLIRTLDEYLAGYEELCSQKEIVLVGRVTQGSSIQRELVKEAKLCAAMVVVLGANRKYSFGGPTCLAKYCAKKLPPTTSVVAIQNGKAVFVREAPKPPLGAEPKPLLRTILHPSVGMEPKVIIPNPNRSARSMDFDAMGCAHAAAATRSKDDDAVRDGGVATLEQRLGWPAARRAPAAAVATPSPKREEPEPRKQSVVHWVMSLPRRSSPLASPEPQSGLAAELKAMLGDGGARCRWFRYEELYESTNHFSSGPFLSIKQRHVQSASIPISLLTGSEPDRERREQPGCTKAASPAGSRVAIKLSKASAEASKDFLREVDIITKLQHPRIVPLIGVCVEGPNLISVYSYLPRGSLEDNLHASDFGLAIWAPSNPTSLTHSDVVGTFGYLAPEYFMYGKVTHKLDVYAFGVVLLELLSGRKPISSDGASPKGQESLVMWVRCPPTGIPADVSPVKSGTIPHSACRFLTQQATPVLNSGDISELLDSRLDVKHDEVEVKRMATAASLCLRRSARLRPPISQILSLLRGESTASIADQGAEPDCLDDETYPAANVRSHLGLALLDVDDAESISSTEHSSGLSPLEEYLRERWSRSSSFD